MYNEKWYTYYRYDISIYIVQWILYCNYVIIEINRYIFKQKRENERSFNSKIQKFFIHMCYSNS